MQYGLKENRLRTNPDKHQLYDNICTHGGSTENYLAHHAVEKVVPQKYGLCLTHLRRQYQENH